MNKKLTIIGAGPKALNILAKAEALKQDGWDVPEILVIEKSEIGAHWTGNHGYTDGTGVLGISPFKAMNYPSKSIFGEKVTEYMEKYSFTNYLSVNGKLEKWVDGGTNWINHKEFAEYLKWIGSYFSEQIHFGEVTEVIAKNHKWLISYQDHMKGRKVLSDGLIITGPGEVMNPFQLKPDNISVFDGKNWWKEKSKFINFEGQVALIGGGISAGSIFESLMPVLGKNSSLDWYTRKGLFTRSENFTNNQRFSLPDLWQQIPVSARRSFISATDRGSIDSTTHKAMYDYNQSFQEVISDIKIMDKKYGKIRILFEDGLGEKIRFYDKVIFCTGFNDTDFLGLLDSDSRRMLGTKFENHIEPDLSVEFFNPKLHLPMLSGIKVGIGCATLGSPSVMSDRILSAWTTKDKPIKENLGVEVRIGGLKGDSLFSTKEFISGENVVNGYPTSFCNKRTKTSVQIGIDLHMEPSHLFVKANHSCDPNCGIQANKQGGYSLVAMRKILTGEEITWDYAMSEWESKLESIECGCKSSICRGKIRGYKKLPNDIKQKYSGFTAPYLKYFE